MANVKLKHTGAVIDQQIDRVIDGSVVVDNTLSALDETSNKPVNSQGIAEAIEVASNNLKARGYIYMGVATPTTTPDRSGGKVFYLAAQAGEYTNFGITLPTDALTSLEWDGERWFAIRIADLVTPAEVEQAILDNTAKKIEKGEAMPVASEVVAEALEARDKQLENKADKTEYYPEMAVGIADNLRGRGEAKEEIYTYRPSAGANNSISEEGVATMKCIKGNSLVWNQLIERMNNPERDGLSFTYENGILTVNGVAQVQWYLSLFTTPIQNSDHTFLLSVKKIDGQYTKASEGTRRLWICNGTDGWGGAADSDNNYKIFAGVSYKDLGLACNVGDAFDNCRLVIEYHDLTQMFGAGNEPTTLEEFYAHIPAGIDINAYNKGQLISMNASAIKTTGFNQWDEQWEKGVYQIWEGGSGKKLNSEGYDIYIRSANYIDVLPNTTYCVLTPNQKYVAVGGFDKENVLIGQFEYDKITPSYGLFTTPRNCAKIVFYIKSAEYNNDICINLSHSGVRNGEYEPYEERTKDLSEIARYFHEGMKSVGEVFDEINEHEAVQRVGQRAYTEGDNDNPAVMTDGVNTIYPLDTPIVTPMLARTINLNYPVWDWGTEKAVSSKLSAPFRADIVYGFNAVDTIRINKLDIEALMLRVAELEAKIAETSTTTMEEENL